MFLRYNSTELEYSLNEVNRTLESISNNTEDKTDKRKSLKETIKDILMPSSEKSK